MEILKDKSNEFNLSIIINRPDIVENKDTVEYKVMVNYKKGEKTLWYRLAKEYAYLLSDRADAAVIALLIPAMVKGEDIHVKGTISESLYWSITDRYQILLKAIIPTLNIINIYPTELRDEVSNATGVATGFSGGIDSFTVLADYYYRKTTQGFHITHLLFNNVGSHGSGSDNLFYERYNKLKTITDKIGLPFIAVNSNLDAFYQGIGFQKTHTNRNVSVAHLLNGGIRRFLYASTFNYRNVFIGPTYDMAYCDSIILPLLSTPTLDCISVGSEYNRVEKTLKVAKIKDSYDTLNVCVKSNQGKNCSVCWKCMRTLLTLEINGYIHLYKNVFDIQAYFNKRNIYIAKVIRSKDPLLVEIKDHAKTIQFKFPLISYIYAYLNFPKLIKLPGFVAKRGKMLLKKFFKNL